MTWLLALYPRAWRRRYGGEMADLLAGRPFSLRIAIDLVAGAIDVWLHPAETLAAAFQAAPGKDEPTMTMMNRILRFECAAAAGMSVSRTEALKSASAMLGATLVLTLAWMSLHARFPHDPIVESLGFMPFSVGLLVSMRYTYLKERSGAVQVIFIGGTTLVLAAILIAAGLLAAQL